MTNNEIMALYIKAYTSKQACDFASKEASWVGAGARLAGRGANLAARISRKLGNKASHVGAVANRLGARADKISDATTAAMRALPGRAAAAVGNTARAVPGAVRGGFRNAGQGIANAGWGLANRVNNAGNRLANRMAGRTPNLANIINLTGNMAANNINRVGRGFGAGVAHIPGSISGAVRSGVKATAMGAGKFGRGLRIGGQAIRDAAVNGAMTTGRGVRAATPYALKYGLPTAAAAGAGYVAGSNNQEQ